MIANGNVMKIMSFKMMAHVSFVLSPLVRLGNTCQDVQSAHRVWCKIPSHILPAQGSETKTHHVKQVVLPITTRTTHRMSVANVHKASPVRCQCLSSNVLTRETCFVNGARNANLEHICTCLVANQWTLFVCHVQTTRALRSRFQNLLRGLLSITYL